MSCNEKTCLWVCCVVRKHIVGFSDQGTCIRLKVCSLIFLVMDLKRNLKWQLLNTTKILNSLIKEQVLLDMTGKNVSTFYRGLGCFSSCVEWFVSYLVRLAQDWV